MKFACFSILERVGFRISLSIVISLVNDEWKKKRKKGRRKKKREEQFVKSRSFSSNEREEEGMSEPIVFYP